MGLINPSEDTGAYWESRAAKSCPLCGGTGFQLVEVHGQVKARRCRCISPERITALRMGSQIPFIHWSKSLEKVRLRTLEEIWLADFLRDFLNQRDLPLIQIWIGPAEPQVSAIVMAFANDLIQLRGYSCLWLNCLALNLHRVRFRKQKLLRQARFDEDFVFVENYRHGLLSDRQQRQLEEVLWERLRTHKSTLFVGNSTRALMECGDLFEDRELTQMILKKFRLVEPAAAQEHAETSRWLF